MRIARGPYVAVTLSQYGPVPAPAEKGRPVHRQARRPSHRSSRSVDRQRAGLPGRVAEFIGKLLILDLDGRNAGGFVAAHSVRDIEQAAVTGIGVGDERRYAGRAMVRARSRMSVKLASPASGRPR